MEYTTLQVILNCACTLIVGGVAGITVYLWKSVRSENIRGASLYFSEVLLTCMLAIAGMWIR